MSTLERMTKEIKGEKYGRLYLESYKREKVAEVELEGSINMVCERHGLSITTIQRWLKTYGSPSYQQSKHKRRSLDEIYRIAREIVSGKLSIEDAMLKYNTESRETVVSWVRKYKQQQDTLVSSVSVDLVLSGEGCLTDVAAAAALKLAELKIRALEMMLDIASKEFKVDIRKKFGAKP